MEDTAKEKHEMLGQCRSPQLPTLLKGTAEGI